MDGGAGVGRVGRGRGCGESALRDGCMKDAVGGVALLGKAVHMSFGYRNYYDFWIESLMVAIGYADSKAQFIRHSQKNNG